MPLLHHINIKFTQAIEAFDRTSLPVKVQLDIPYYAQWESPELIADFLANTSAAVNDPQWADSGAESAELYSIWAPHICGMACFKMILAASQHIIVPIIDLALSCANYGGYKLPLNQHIGLHYQAFKVFVEQRYQLHADIARPLTLHKIRKAVVNNQYVMASVSSNIDQAPAHPSHTGHLVVITGYDHRTKTITFHNPGGRTTQTQANSQLTYQEFERYFNHKGLILTAST